MLMMELAATEGKIPIASPEGPLLHELATSRFIRYRRRYH